MAKRKRLSPAAMHGAGAQTPETKSVFSGPPPIASVAGEAAQTAALETLAEEIRQARESGRMIQDLPLDAIDEAYLRRDRVSASKAEFDALVESLRQRGQQTPIEVMALEGGRYGLISGWRRLQALRLLSESEPARFSTVLAILRRPEDAGQAYLAMVEENEIREGLSYYERARIAWVAMEEGVFDSSYDALQTLFASASRSKRSKIGSFIRLHRGLWDVLEHPTLIPERLGLQLAKAMEEDPQLCPRLRETLLAAPNRTAEQERAILEDTLRTPARGRPTKAAQRSRKASAGVPRDAAPVTPDIALRYIRGEIVLSGHGVDAALQKDLSEWLKTR